MQDNFSQDNNNSVSGDNFEDTLMPENTENNNFEGGESNDPNLDIGQENSVAPVSNNDNVLDVDSEFGGDLATAIASANSGDTVRLGSNTYSTNGITIDKNITIDGNGGSVIDGNGTSGTILTLGQGASGATVRNVQITNGNNGIFGNGATNLTLENLNINNIGLNGTNRSGENNTGIIMFGADGLQLRNSNFQGIGRKAVGLGDTNGAEISGLSVRDVNLAAEHAQSHDAAGVKLYNTNNVAVRNSNFADINAFNIWNDTASNTTIEGNTVQNVGEDFLAPGFNNNVNIAGIYDEKSSSTRVSGNSGTSVADRFLVFDATEFSSQSIDFGDNDFSHYQLGTQDYWFNEQAEKLIATTEDPTAVGFNSVSSEYYGQANIG